MEKDLRRSSTIYRVDPFFGVHKVGRKNGWVTLLSLNQPISAEKPVPVLPNATGISRPKFLRTSQVKDVISRGLNLRDLDVQTLSRSLNIFAG
jgi:hypothetical protein